jgi:hypothetical protein
MAQREQHIAAISIAISSTFSLFPSTPKPEPVDGFEFGVTLNYGGGPDSIRLPRKFADMVDVRMNQVLL